MFLMRMLAYVLCVFYLGVLMANLDFIKKNGRTIWQNYESMVFYTLFTLQMTTLHEYGKSKIKDCDELIEQIRFPNKKKSKNE